MEQLILKSTIQYGFAGLSAVQLCLLVWLVRRLLSALEQNTRIISANTAVIESLEEKQRDLLTLTRRIYDRLISRPCLKCND